MQLDILRPQAVAVELSDHLGNALAVIHVRPLSYTEWQNAALGVPLPQRMVRQEFGQPMVDVSNTPEYQQALIEYNEGCNLRRLALALDAGGDFPELKGKAPDAQCELLRGLDAGILNALLDFLRKMAFRKNAESFRQLLADGAEDVRPQALEPARVDGAQSD